MEAPAPRAGQSQNETAPVSNRDSRPLGGAVHPAMAPPPMTDAAIDTYGRAIAGDACALRTWTVPSFDGVALSPAVDAQDPGAPSVWVAVDPSTGRALPTDRAVRRARIIVGVVMSGALVLLAVALALALRGSHRAG